MDFDLDKHVVSESLGSEACIGFEGCEGVEWEFGAVASEEAVSFGERALEASTSRTKFVPVGFRV